VRPHSIIKAFAVAALIAVPSIAMAAPDQNTNGGYNNNCNGGRWINGRCVYNNGQWNNGQWNNGQWNNGQWNNNRNRHRDRDDDNDRDRDDHRDNGRHNGWYNGNYNGQYNCNGGQWINGQCVYNNGGYNNGGYYNGGYNNGYGNNGYGRGQLTGTVSSFSPYNLYLRNGIHVELHDGTIINPTGTNLSPGMRVRVIGYRNSDGSFAANEIDVVR
jgi:hypothetical protein